MKLLKQQSALDKNKILLWCGYGACESLAANNGALGLTEEDAYVTLITAIEKEQNAD